MRLLFGSFIGFLLYVIWQVQELKKFQVTSYETTCEKVNTKIKLVVISDLHSFSYGKRNERLIHAVRKEKPDLILIPGDLIVSSQVDKYMVSLEAAKEFCTVAPTVFCNGNHESLTGSEDFPYTVEYQEYYRQLVQAGVIVLDQAHEQFMIRGCPVRVSGLELPLSCYKKWKKPYLKASYIKSQLGAADEEHLQILLAHHPAFAEQYAHWGADITVCGHNHGGLIRLPGLGSVISPQFMLFPKYDAGEFTVSGKKIYISRGLGTHTLHIRIFDRAELMTVTVKPKADI